MSAPAVNDVKAFLSVNRKNITEVEFLKVYNEYGKEAFTSPTISEPMKQLRNVLLRNERLPAWIYAEIVENTKKFSRYDVEEISSHPHVYVTYAIFERFWKIDRNATMRGVQSFLTHHTVYSFSWVKGGWWEELPTVHSEHCGQGEDKHYWCRAPKRFHADVYLKAAEEIREEVLALVDPRVIATIQTEIFELSERSRVAYANSSFVRDDHWAFLAADKREVLNTLTHNALLPTHIAEQIVFNHKTPYLRESIAKYTTDPNLLRVIWAGTKSASIREAVESNPLFPGVE